MVGLGGGRSKQFFVNQMDVQEIQLEMGGMAADIDTGGVQMNVVPKSGGNTFAGSANFDFTNGDLQADNLTDELRARGLTTVTQLKKVYDYGGGFGGPMKQNKLWFYTSHRWWGSQEWAADKFYNLNQGGPIFAPDLSRQAHTDFYQQEAIRAASGGRRPTSRRIRSRCTSSATATATCSSIFRIDRTSPRSITRTTASGWARRHGSIRSPIACCSRPAPPTFTT